MTFQKPTHKPSSSGQPSKTMNVITGKIDVTKIDKNKLFKGAKGTYLDIVLIPTPDGKYGDFMVVQSVTKEERESGVKGAILGNAKNAGQRGPNTPQRQRHPDDDEDIPF